MITPPGEGKPPSPLGDGDSKDRVTRMTGGLETLKMGEQTDSAPVVRKGEAGTTIKLSANYIRLELAPERGMWEYEVRFAPPIDSKDERHKLLNQHRELFGAGKVFDGSCLSLPERLQQDRTDLEAVHSTDGSTVMLTITLKHQKKMADRSCTQFYNVLFRRIMNTLKMVQMNKNYYDPTSWRSGLGM